MIIILIAFLVYLIPQRNHDPTFAHNSVPKMTWYLWIRSSMKLLSATLLKRAEEAMKKPVYRQESEGCKEKE